MNDTFVSLIKMEGDSECGDFNGTHSCLNLNSQIEYLEKYFLVAKSEYHFDENKHVIEQQEIDEPLNQIPYEEFAYRNRRKIVDGKITLTNLQEYKYLTLFNGAVFENRSILFKEVQHTPLPAMEIEYKEIKSIKFIIEIDEKSLFPLRGGVDTMVPARNIEFKNGVQEVLKLSLYSDGSLYLRASGNDPYHHKNIRLGTAIDGKIDVDISFVDKKIAINSATMDFEPTTSAFPNILFAGSGLHIRSKWSISILLMNDNESINHLFSKRVIFEQDESANTKLPFAFGTYKNRHKSAIFEKEFEINKTNKKYLLHIEEVGPSGIVYINEEKAFEINDLSSADVDITNYIHQGVNQLKIIVQPQAPENVISWHRHKDPYFGSYLGDIWIDEVNEQYIQYANLETTKVVDDSISIRSSFDIKGDASTIETSIYELTGELVYKSLEKEFAFKAVPWSFDNPKLYKVIYSLINQNQIVDQYEVITGFRTISQNGGAFLLNGKKEILKGALLMQYLPPYEDIPLNHVMPSSSQIVMQIMQAKKMNANCLRMHQLGYGSNDYRFARICDYLGISTIWTTRLIDTAFSIVYDGAWHQKEIYQKQMKRVINAPSIIMWEGANEYYLYRCDIDAIYKEFVRGVKEIDATRLISPVSHLYYANDSYNKNCEYYQDSGLKDEYFKEVKATPEWNDPLVVRSAHTYNWLLGYGSTWDKLKEQSWSAQPELLNSKNHMYMVSEYAVIGRQNPFIKEARQFFNNDSYEYPDERANGYDFDDKTWYLSQAYQSLAATYTTRKMLSLGVDGLLWCSLNGGANNGSYLKPIIDFYGYPKLAFYALRSCFDEITAFIDDTDIVWDNQHQLKPILITNEDGKRYNIQYYIKDIDGRIMFEADYVDIKFNQKQIRLEPKSLPILEDGYYSIHSKIQCLEE